MHTETPPQPTKKKKKTRGPLRSTPHSLVEPDAASYLGVSRAFLRQSRRSVKPAKPAEPAEQEQRARRTTGGPAYVRIGRAVRYRVTDLDAYLTAHRVEPRDACAKGAG